MTGVPRIEDLGGFPETLEVLSGACCTTTGPGEDLAKSTSKERVSHIELTLTTCY